MSHNYQYRGQPLDSSLRSDPGSYSSSGRPHTLPDYDFTRAPQESHQSLSSPSTNVSRSSQESAFSVLSSCGLEPSDLALLAEMPEDALTVESLPHVLRQIKGKRGTVKPYLQGSPSPSSSSSSCAPSSTHRPATSPSTSHWDHPRSHTLQYSTDQVEPSPPSSELDRWGNPITLSCAKAQPCSSSSPSSYVVDFHHRSNLSMYGKTCRDPSPVSSQNYFHNSGTPDFVKPGRSSHQVPSQDFHHRPGTSKFGETSRNAAPASTENYYYRPGPPEYGNTGRDVGPSSSQNQPSFSSAGRDQTTHPSLSSQPGQAVYMLPPPAQESHHGPSFGGSRSETSSTRSSSSTQSAASLPSRQNALDFHGVTPPFYPHSCSLCAITVMSEKVWLKHINGPHHADGQLNLLQKYPSWDCRMETVERANNQPGQRKEEENAVKTQTANQSPNPLQPNTKTQKKISEKSKVVCVKFPAHAVDEAYLRKLAEPFGKVIKIIMFPSLAFVELGSIDQARDLVKFHTNYPPTVNGALMEFRISDTFNFLQSSSVVSFFPTPSGEDSKSDLISIIKRFGSPLYTLFLPSRAFVEMKDAATAQKIVNYYSSNNLRINDDVIKVSFSGEYKSLMRIPSAKRYREETTTTSKTTERMRRRSRTRSRSSSREKSPKERKSRTRSKSKEKPDKNRKSKSRERSSHERRTRSRSRSREKASRVSSRSGDRSSRDEKTRTRSKSKEKITNERKSASMTSTVSTESSSDPHPVRDTPEAAEKEHVQEEAESSDDESDIEGMEVIGEDGENVQDDEMETADEAGDDEEEKKEHPAERKHSPEGDKEEMKNEEASHHEQPEEDKEKEEEKISVKEEKKTNSAGETEGEPDFPFNLDSCITLDELKEDDSDDPDEDSRYERKPLSRRVLYFKNVPVDVFTDAEFIQLVRGYGTAKLFLRVPGRQTGFIEMSSSAEAQRVKDALTAQPLCVNNCRVFVQISSNYPRLFNGCSVKSIENIKEDKEHESRSRSSSRSERLSKTSDREGRKSSSRRSQERESKTSQRKSLERESTPRKSSEKKSPEKISERLSRTPPESKSTDEKSSRNESTTDKNAENKSNDEKTSENESTNDKTAETESTNEKTSERESTTEKSSKNKSITDETSENESTNEKTSENESTNEKTSENNSTNEKSSENDSTNEKSSERESASRLTAEESQDEKNLEKEPKQISRTDPEETSQTDLKTSTETNLASDQSPEKESGEKRTCKRRGTPENDSVPEKKEKKTGEEETQIKDAEASREEKLKIQERTEDFKRPDQPDSPGDPPRPQTEQLSNSLKPADQLEDSEIREGPHSEPVIGAEELQKSLKPVGTEFVRPVVGYFCNLCQVIYANEDEAKEQHCSSEEHYRKYQEKTRKDPWAS